MFSIAIERLWWSPYNAPNFGGGHYASMVLVLYQALLDVESRFPQDWWYIFSAAYWDIYPRGTILE